MDPHPWSETGLEIAAEIGNPARWLAMMLTKSPPPETVGPAMDIIENLAQHAIARVTAELRAHVVDLAEAERLREALRPIAAVAAWLPYEVADGQEVLHPDKDAFAVPVLGLTAAELRQAAEALEGP